LTIDTGGGILQTAHRRLLKRNPLHIDRCGARSNRRSQATVRSPILKPPPGLCSCDVTPAKLMAESECASASGQAQIRPRKDFRNHHAATATRLSEVDASGAAPSAPIRYAGTTTSTLRMGRRIMAERRRRRTGRGRRNCVRARARDIGRSTNGADESLRAFVRALARQAARECFRLELKRQPRSIQ
jgi:hypothetical protein